MIGKPSSGQDPNIHPLHKQRFATAVVLLFMLSLQSFDLQAALSFRSLERVGGQQRWSPVRNFSSPADTAYLRASAGGAAAPAEEVRVFLSGEITRADVDGAVVMETLLKSGKQRIANNTVWFASNGGDIDAAMELGRQLRRLGIFTLIAKNDQCLSACIFAFMGGERRSVAGRLGIHRPYFPFTDASPDRQARFRHLQKTLKDFIAELDFPDSLYETVMLVPPESMRILAPADLKRFYLDGVSPSSEDMADAASARRLNISMFEYLQRKAKASACAFFDTSRGRCEDRALEAMASGSAADDPGNARTNEFASAGRTAGRGAGDAQGAAIARGKIRRPPESLLPK